MLLMLECFLFYFYNLTFQYAALLTMSYRENTGCTGIHTIDCIVDPDSYQENHVHPRDISALLSGRSYLLFI